MRSMQWQLGMLGTISAFAYRHRETEKNLCRGGRSQDLPSTDFQPAVWQLKYVTQQYTHSTTNTQKITTTIHTTNRQQLNTRQLKISNNTHETNQNTTCTKGKNTQAREYCVQFLVIVFFFFQSLIHSRFHPSPSLLITYYSYSRENKDINRNLYQAKRRHILLGSSLNFQNTDSVHFGSQNVTKG